MSLVSSQFPKVPLGGHIKANIKFGDHVWAQWSDPHATMHHFSVISRMLLVPTQRSWIPGPNCTSTVVWMRIYYAPSFA